MPLVTIEDRAPDDPRAIDAALARVADAVAVALGRPAGGVWTRFLASERVRFGAASDGVRHPIVTISTGAQPAAVRERVLRAAAAAVAETLDTRPDEVWARFDVLDVGTVLADGVLQ